MQFQCLWCLHFSVNCRFSFCWSGAVFLVPSGYMCILLARFLFPYVCMLPFLALLAPLALLALWLVSWLPCLWFRFDSSSYLCLSILYVFYCIICIVLWRALLLSLWFDYQKQSKTDLAFRWTSILLLLSFHVFPISAAKLCNSFVPCLALGSASGLLHDCCKETQYGSLWFSKCYCNCSNSHRSDAE